MKGEGLAFRIRPGATLAPTVALLREATGLPVDQLAVALKTASGIQILEEWANCRSEERTKLLELFDRICNSGASCEVWLGAEQVSRPFLENQIAHRREIEEETKMLMDLESGSPSEEALAWCSRGLKE